MIDKGKFFNGYREEFGSLEQDQVDGLNFLLGSFESDTRWSDPRDIAYALATIVRETGHKYQPISELGGNQYLSKYWTNPHLRAMLGNIEPADAQKYKGRGYIQITGRANYRKFGLDDNPESALKPQTAFEIMTKGMFGGLFTGKSFGDFINDHETDYVGARKIINGQDRAHEIAHDASIFESILRSSQVVLAGVTGGGSQA